MSSATYLHKTRTIGKCCYLKGNEREGKWNDFATECSVTLSHLLCATKEYHKIGVKRNKEVVVEFRQLPSGIPHYTFCHCFRASERLIDMIRRHAENILRPAATNITNLEERERHLRRISFFGFWITLYLKSFSRFIHGTRMQREEILAR